MAGRKRKDFIVDGVVYKECLGCKQTKEINCFSVSNSRRGYTSPFCKECTNTKHRQMYLHNPKSFYESASEWAKRNPEKRRAHEHLTDAIRKGKIRRPDTCEKCNRKTKVDGHHWMGYSPENYLNVQWLCRSCHKEVI